MANDSTRSYLSVSYDLRPSKQVERRMLLDFFRRLAGCDIAIEKYRYTGMGSVHFVDHILFHKFLGIDKFVSVERDEDIARRVEFNRPFGNVEIEIMEIGEYIPKLAYDEDHIVWLDYDCRLSTDILNDVKSSAYVLPPGSFVFVTVDAEPPPSSAGPSDNYDFFKDLSRNLWDPRWRISDFGKESLHLRVLDLLGRAIKEGVAGRPGVKALPCFSIAYADGHEMATLGVQLGGNVEEDHLRQVKDDGATYLVLSFNDKPFYINVPVLTRRERLYFETIMTSGDFNRVRSAGVDENNFRNFANVYRFLPSYAELFLG